MEELEKKYFLWKCDHGLGGCGLVVWSIILYTCRPWVWLPVRVCMGCWVGGQPMFLTSMLFSLSLTFSLKIIYIYIIYISPSIHPWVRIFFKVWSCCTQLPPTCVAWWTVYPAPLSSLHPLGSVLLFATINITMPSSLTLCDRSLWQIPRLRMAGLELSFYTFSKWPQSACPAWIITSLIWWVEVQDSPIFAFGILCCNWTLSSYISWLFLFSNKLYFLVLGQFLYCLQ